MLPSVRRSSPFNVVAPARTACVDDRQAHDAQNLVIVTSSRLFAGERVRHVPNRRALMLTKHRWQWHCSANVALSMKPAAVAADACPLSPATCLRPHSARERESCSVRYGILPGQHRAQLRCYHRDARRASKTTCTYPHTGSPRFQQRVSCGCLDQLPVTRTPMGIFEHGSTPTSLARPHWLQPAANWARNLNASCARAFSQNSTAPATRTATNRKPSFAWAVLR